MTRRRKFLLWTGGGVLGLVALACVLLVGGYFYLQTDGGRRFVVQQIEDTASGDGTTLAIGRLEGSLTSSFTFHDIVLSDDAGTFARVNRLAVAWRPLDLLRGRVMVERIAANEANVERLPPGTKAAEEAGGPPGLGLGIDIAVNRVSVDALRLGDAVAGAPVRLAADGSAALDAAGESARVRLDVRRIDRTGGRASLSLDYAARPARFAAHAEIHEPQGGELGRLLGLPGRPAVSVRLDGTGPADDWRGTLRAAAGEVGATVDLSVAVRDGGIAVAAKGDAQVAPLLLPWMVPLVGARTSFDAAVRSRADGGWILERLALEGDAVRVDGSARYTPEDDGTVTADLVAVAQEPLAIPANAPQVHADKARIAVHVEGPVAQPRATATISARRLGAGGVGAGEADAALRLSMAQSGALSFDGSVRLSRLETGAAVPAGLLGDSATLRFNGSAGSDGGVTLSEIEVRSGGLAASANGRYAAGGDVSGAYRIALERLGAWAEEAGLSPDGSIRLSGGFRADADRLTGTAEIGGEIAGVVPQSAPYAGLIGDRVPLSAALQRRADGTIGLNGLDVRLAAGRMRGEAAMTPENGSLRGRLELVVPALAPLSPVVGTELAGRGRLQLDVEGPLESVAARATLRLDDARAAGMAMDRIELRADARRTESGGAGTIAFTTSRDGRILPGKLRFALDQRTVRLADIAIGKGANRATGNLRVGLDDRMADGTLSVRLGALSALPLPKAALPDGTIDLSVRFARANGQRVTLQGKGSAIRISLADGKAAAIGNATVNATVENALAAPRVRGRIGIEKASFGEGVLSRLVLAVRAEGTEAISFDGKAEGNYRVPIALSFAGRSAFAGEEISVRLMRLAGTVSGTQFAATQPLQAVWRDGLNWSGRAALKIATGTVSASAARNPARLDAQADIRELPLALVALVAPGVALDGTLSARARLAGPPAGLGGRAAIEVAGVRPRDAGWAANDSFALSANATLDGEGLALTGRLRGPQQTAIDLRADTPLRFALADEGVAVTADGPVNGSVTIAGELALVDRLIGLGENRLAGRVHGKVDLGGTVEAPQVNGNVSLADGRFESVKSGTTIRDMAATVRFDGSSLRLVAFEARDAGDGRIGGEGTVRLDAAAGWPVDLRFSFAQFAALARDDATVRATGDLRLQGKAASPGIAGSLRVDNGEIRIPDRLGGGAATLDVIEVNAPSGLDRPATAAEEQSSSPAVAIPLDVVVTVPGRVFVRGRGLDSEWQGKLTITGTTAKPRIVGDVSVARGSFALAGRDFDLREGRITFHGGDPPDPELAIRAVAPVQSIEAAIVVSGTSSKPKIELQSTPALPNDEILSRILFGKSFGQLNAIQAAQLAQSAAQLAGGPSGLGALERIRRTLGIDVLSVGSQDESLGGASLQAGKYITEDVFVSVDQGTQPGSQKVGVEIELTPNITVETDVGPEAGNSVGLNWKWDY